MSLTRNAFETLGLAADAGPDLVKARWKELAKLHHPDLGGDANEFHRLHQAYSEALEETLAAPCAGCGGAGSRKLTKGFHQLTVPCDACEGTGRKHGAKD